MLFSCRKCALTQTCRHWCRLVAATSLQCCTLRVHATADCTETTSSAGQSPGCTKEQKRCSPWRSSCMTPSHMPSSVQAVRAEAGPVWQHPCRCSLYRRGLYNLALRSRHGPHAGGHFHHRCRVALCVSVFLAGRRLLEDRVKQTLKERPDKPLGTRVCLYCYVQFSLKAQIPKGQTVKDHRGQRWSFR